MSATGFTTPADQTQSQVNGQPTSLYCTYDDVNRSATVWVTSTSAHEHLQELGQDLKKASDVTGLTVTPVTVLGHRMWQLEMGSAGGETSLACALAVDVRGHSVDLEATYATANATPQDLPTMRPCDTAKKVAGDLR